MSESEFHVSRSFHGPSVLEVECPCEKGPCGYAIQNSAPECVHHGFLAGKTIRDGHLAHDCPDQSTAKSTVTSELQ